MRRGITEWLKAWKARGWRTADRKPVKNQDLWQRLDELAADIEWRWVKAIGVPGNERVDQLANEAIDAAGDEAALIRLAANRELLIGPLLQCSPTAPGPAPVSTLVNSRPMRQIVLDTETTGLEPELGHRIIEIGCVELVNRRVTGRTFHRYLNPERDIDEGAHGRARHRARRPRRASRTSRKSLKSC